MACRFPCLCSNKVGKVPEETGIPHVLVFQRTTTARASLRIGGAEVT